MNTPRLIHPIYLDVSMLVSFAAAMHGGIALSSEVTSERENSLESSHQIQAKAKISDLFASFFKAEISAQAVSDRAKEERETRRESRTHTEASLAILLYDQLVTSSGALLRPQSLDDFRSVEPGSLVELYGSLKKNAVDAMIEYIDVVNLMSQLDTSAHAAKQKGVVNPLLRIREVLDKDRKRTPLSNIIMKCHRPSTVTASITLRRENLRDLTFSELHNNAVRLIGKVTRVIDQGSSMSAFENYGLSIMNPNDLETVFKGLSSVEGIRAEFSEVEIHGPAVQILPLMVFV